MQVFLVEDSIADSQDTEFLRKAQKCSVTVSFVEAFALLMIHHLMSYVMSLSFSSQTYFESTVSRAGSREWSRFLKESLWLLNLVLKSFSVMPM